VLTPRAPGEPPGERHALAAMVPLLAVNVALSIASDLAHHLVLTLALLGAAFAWLAWTARWLEASRSSARGLSSAILAGALLLRLPLLPLPLTLSDDALRYLWDGKVAAAGLNPYALPPAAQPLTFLRDDVWHRLPHREVPTVYPPLSVAAFSIAARLPNPILAWKALVTAADLAACALLLALTRRLGLPPARALWYAWNPLVAIECSGMAHVDALGVAASVATVFCLAGPRCRSWAAAAAWSAAAILAKLAPATALPMWSRWSGHPARMLAAAGALVGAACLPVVAATGGVPPGLRIYAISWEFDGPLFEPLWRLLDAAGAAPRLALLLDAVKRQTGEPTRFNPLYHYLYPQLLAKVVLGLGLVAVVAASLRLAVPREPRQIAAATGWLLGAMLLLSATVYPWYVLWVAPWAALCRHTAWRALSGLILLSYLTQRGGVPLMPWVYLSIWVPFGVLLAAGRRWASA
jgi:alpha-1,6-mannosyltransferase